MARQHCCHPSPKSGVARAPAPPPPPGSYAHVDSNKAFEIFHSSKLISIHSDNESSFYQMKTFKVKIIIHLRPRLINTYEELNLLSPCISVRRRMKTSSVTETARSLISFVSHACADSRSSKLSLDQCTRPGIAKYRHCFS